ncbi:MULTISPECIES: hypothetical protein [Streptomyces]|uniref:Uncharacterized protein n=2 Tax=Streptomyces TaxID=1883 RepID=A0ABV9J7Z4_9ACTN
MEAGAFVEHRIDKSAGATPCRVRVLRSGQAGRRAAGGPRQRTGGRRTGGAGPSLARKFPGLEVTEEAVLQHAVAPVAVVPHD